MLPALLPMRPYLREMIWGGRGLQLHYNKPLPPGKSIGESWEVSAYPDMESTVAAGPLAGQPLRQLVEIHGHELLGRTVYNRYDGEFPLLVKLLDAQKDLSIQVHPDDAYARMKNIGNFGKMEAWYVLHSDNGQIACGLKDGVDKPAFVEAIRNNRVEDAVQFFTARPGDVIFIPPGTVHALCRGVMVYEVQQSSDLTFRIYDYNRPGSDGKPRELHIENALEVITFGESSRAPVSWCDLPGATSNHTLLIESEHFRLERCNPPERKTEHSAYPSLAAVTFLEGNAEITSARESYPGKKGDTFLIRAGRPFQVLHRDGLHPEYLISSIP